jgi:hypothetical protein
VTATRERSSNTAKMVSKLMLVFVGFDVIFAMCGGLVMGFSLISEQMMTATPTVDNVAQNLLLDQCPLTGTTNFISGRDGMQHQYGGATVAAGRHAVEQKC